MSSPFSYHATPGAPIDLQVVRRLFSRPARLADAQFLRREVAARMAERLGIINLAPECVLDAGCGAGDDLSILAQRFANARVMGVDGAVAMLMAVRQSRQSQQWQQSPWLTLLRRFSRQTFGPSLVCANFADLPLAAGAVDMIWSNLALHWHPQPERVFAEWRRVMRPNGLPMFSCFGPDTLQEIRAAFAGVDHTPHTLSFADMHDLGDLLGQTGFTAPVMESERITVTYPNVNKLLADVRALGGNPLATRRRGLMGAQRWRRAIAALEQTRRADGAFALTFEVVYGHAFRLESAKTRKIVRFVKS